MSARILVVEDEEALTTLLRYNLDAEGYDVETVARGDDADTRLKERVPAECGLVDFFREHPGRVSSREELLDSVWGRDIYIVERTVDDHIGRLRKLLNPGREQDPIRTVRGAGYALDDRFDMVERRPP